MLAHMLRFLQGSKVNSTCRSPGDRESLHHAHDSSSADCQPFQHADESNSNANVAKDDGKRRGIFGFLKLHSDCPSKAALRACPPSPRTSSAAETNAYDEHEGDTRWQSAETDDRKPNDSCSPPDSSNDSSTSGAGACSELYCPACGELGGALLCHECGPRPDNTFLRHYRRSYLYKALDILLSLAEFVGRSFLCVGSMLSKYLCTGGGKSEANEDAGVGGFKARRAAPSGLQLTEGACRAVRRRPGKGTQQKCSPNSDIQGPTDEQRQSVQHDTTEAAGKETNKQRQQEECKGNKLTPPPLRDPGSVTHKFWATVNFLEDLFVSLSLRHPLSGWLSWSLLSIGFYCVLNCMLWPLLILFFVYRRIRFYAWEAAVRLRRSIVFSDDLLAQLQRQQQQQLTSSRGWGLIPLPVPRGVGSKGVAPIEILSLMESQEKLFFSMPWMAVTGFSYCERLSFQELCMAITQKLLKPKQEFACLANCTGGSDFLDQLPVSAFLHPRLLARVQRVMGRYCWVRQPGFKVSQQVIKFTKKGINVLRKQRCAAKGEPEEGSKSGEENSCFCRSAAECNCLMDEADVLCLVNEALSQPLDPMKPLWQFLYLENVIMPPNPAENPLQKERIGSAVVFRMHHAVGDGISITRMFLKDFLCSSPANPGCSINDRPFYPIDATEESFLQDKTTSGGDGVEGAASSLSRASISNQPVSATHKCEEGTPVSAASTSTMWTVSGLSLKACVDGCDATTEKCMQRSSQAVGGAPTNGGPVTVAAAAQVGAAQKPPVSICSIPNTVFWRLFVALRFALQLPFYGAGMAMLLSYDELLKAPRSGSANRTRIAPPICLSLQELKDLKTRLIVALAKQQQQQQQQQQEQQHVHAKHSAKDIPAISRLFSRLFTSYKMQKGEGEGNNIKVTLNDIFATCIVGGYYRCTSRQEREKSLRSLTKGIKDNNNNNNKYINNNNNINKRKEQMNFVVPVNLRHAEAEAMDLRNRFASLVIQMPITPQGDSLQRMRGVHGALRRSLRSFALPMVMCLERWLYATWPDLLMAYFLRLTHKISVIFSSVIGPAAQPYMYSSRIQRMHFVVPQPGEVGVGISAFSCGGTVSICVSADASVVDDPSLLRQCILDEYSSLMHACKEY